MPDIFHTAAYIRLSREDGDRDESDSVSNQKKLITGYIRRHTELLLYKMYIDDGVSGTTFQRPGFQQMLRDIRDKKITCVIVKDLSRFGRDYIETGRLLERYFPEQGVRFISLSDHIDSLRQSYDILLPIKNIFNEQYARDISAKVRSALLTKRQCGEFIGAFASYGYQKSPLDKNKLIIDEYAASIVRRIFSLYLQGVGKQQIARTLNAEGVLSPSEYKRVLGLQYTNPRTAAGSTLWSYSTINHILHKEIYAGNMVQGIKYQPLRGRQRMAEREKRIIVRQTHEAIIDEDTWKLTQKRLGIRAHSSPAKGERHIFSGLLRCADCNRPMVKTQWRRADGSREYSFTCGTCKRHGRTFCTPHTIPSRLLERIVLDDMNALLTHSGDVSGLIWQALEEYHTNQPTQSIPHPKLAREQTHIRQLLLASYEDYKAGLLSREEFLSCRASLRERERLLSDRLRLFEARSSDSTDKISCSSFFDEENVPKRLETLDARLVSALISDILVYEDHRIRIRYTFSPYPDSIFLHKS